MVLSQEELRRIKADIAMCRERTWKFVNKPEFAERLRGSGYQALYLGCMQDKGYVWK